ncbi:MAG TPA: hypothetical protein IAC41_08075 [Candidatus Merdenecus merdavium]|nr:hypothetical protein [Candidatus Merdenecus merdavium]
MMDKHTNWIWLKKWMEEDKDEPVLALFRKKIMISEKVKSARIRISADSRYKLFVNGYLEEVGPSKGDRQVWFVDEVDISQWLMKGENILAVQVLRYPLEHEKGNHGIFRTAYPGLYVEGGILDAKGQFYDISGDDSWKSRKDNMFHIESESDVFAPLQIYERTGGDSKLQGWMFPSYEDGFWDDSKEYQNISRAVSPGNLIPRTIPYMFRKQGTFERVLVCRKSKYTIQDWEELLKGKKTIEIPSYTKEVIEIAAETEKTAYLHLSVQKGRGTEISILQSEAYVQDGVQGEFPVKGHREDYKNGHLEGFTDHYCVSGFGTKNSPEVYEPFWFRTFRFIRLEIVTTKEPLVMCGLDYTETGYPLNVVTEVKTSDTRLQPIWEMSLRTLKLCMHETYEDCPFYEQLQYAMDARSQILYTYSVSADDRLARKCMDDFRRSQRYDGLLNCSYPCYGSNVIPGFSIYYILMLYDHMMYFGDKELLEAHMPTVERILNYFYNHRTPEGYIQKIGGVNGKDRFWSFIDWTPEWDKTTGVPSATLMGAITVESLLFIMGLQYAAEIVTYLGRDEQAQKYLNWAEAMKEAVRKYCTGDNGMLQDGPGIEAYSQQTQVFGILTETLMLREGKKVLKKTIENKEKYVQCSVAMAFYLFRALHKVELYEYTEEYWNIWTRMLDKGAMTCVENEVGERSECHAWGALILYELPSVVLGVQPAEPGYAAVKIQPEAGYLKEAQGIVQTPKGIIKVKWKKETEMNLEFEVPENVRVLNTDKRKKK